MRQEDWQLVESLFERAVALPAAERRGFIEEAAGFDTALAEEVLALVAAHESRHPLLDAPAAGELPGGMRLGPWAIERLIGTGGMSTVYLAHRADHQFEKRVAIKLLARGLESALDENRFAGERQILAGLEHPHIARLLDSGVNEFHQPYLVMEWVDGQPLDVWAKPQALESRLAIWLKVADAVSYAHRNLIVHRDLKPSNILVNREGEPKLLDFGIAKLLDQAHADTGTRTQYLTPLYASPEQIQGQAITTASDVYSLGVVLCEMAGGAAALHEAPAIPASAPKDLAAVLGMALRKEPSRRYQTVDQFAADVRRYRAGMPVSARPETLAYRATRFVQRHWLGVSAAAAVVAALLALSATAVHQAGVAGRQRDRAEKVTEFLMSILGVSSTGEAWALNDKGASVRLVDVADLAEKRMDGEFAGQPETEAVVRSLVGTVFLKTGQVSRAQPDIRRAASLYRQLYPEDHPRRLLAEALDAALELALGHFEQAEKQASRVLSLWKNPPPLALADTINLMGLSQFREGKLDAAVESLQRALGVVERSAGKDAPGVATVLSNLTLVYLERGQFEQALPQLERTVAITRALSKGPSNSLGWALVNLANTHRFLGRAEEAETNAREALENLRFTLGESNPSLIHPVAILAWAMSVRGEPGAEEIIRRGEGIQQKALAADHFEHAVGLTFLGFVLMNEGKLSEARTALARALEIRRKNFTAPNWRIAETAGFLGETLARQGLKDGARPLLEESRDTFSRLYGPGNVRSLDARARLERWGR